MLRPNIGLVFMRQSANQGQYDHALAVTSLVTDRVFYSANGAPFLAPLYLYPDEGSHNSYLLDNQVGYRESNFSQAFIRSLMTSTKSAFNPQDNGQGAEWLTSEDIFDYIYAVLYCPQFRQRYEVFLKIDFPRIPIPNSRKLFDDLTRLGRHLVSLHLLEEEVLIRGPWSRTC